MRGKCKRTTSVGAAYLGKFGSSSPAGGARRTSSNKKIKSYERSTFLSSSSWHKQQHSFTSRVSHSVKGKRRKLTETTKQLCDERCCVDDSRLPGSVSISIHGRSWQNKGVGEAAVKRETLLLLNWMRRLRGAIYNIRRVAEAGVDVDVLDINSL